MDQISFYPMNLQYFADPEPDKTEPAKTEPDKTEPTKTEPTKTEPTKTEPIKTEPAHKGPTPAEINSELKAAMADAGVPKEKRDYVMRLAKVEGADKEGADLGKLCEEAITKVLQDIPELGGTPSTGSTGNFAKKGAKPDFSKMTDEEYYTYMAVQKAKK